MITSIESVLECVLLLLLAATLFHAVRLERALGVLKRDRATLEALVTGFNTSTRQAETAIGRLRSAADGAGRQVARQIDSATSLKDDLTFLTDRGGRLADRLDELVRHARPMVADAVRPLAAEVDAGEEPRVRSQAERDLLRALRMAR